MKVKNEDGSIKFEGTPSECGKFCKVEDEKEKKIKPRQREEKSKFEDMFSSPKFIG